MAELNQKINKECSNFLNWIQIKIGIPLEELNGKTTLLNFLGDYKKGEKHQTLNTIIDILNNNSQILLIDPNSKNFQQILEQKYQMTLEILLPIKHSLEFSDQIINYVVNQLYRLSEEEKKIVEGN